MNYRQRMAIYHVNLSNFVIITTFVVNVDEFGHESYLNMEIYRL